MWVCCRAGFIGDATIGAVYSGEWRNLLVLSKKDCPPWDLLRECDFLSLALAEGLAGSSRTFT